MSRITEYTSVSAFDENDVLIKDGENGTKIISVEDAAAEFRRLCGINGDISNITDSLSAFGANLAGVETTFVATKNYNIADLFVIDNVLYRATATIASGSEIDPETNCEETSFSTVIEAMNDILAGKADANGTYDNLISGNAKQLVGTVFTEDDAAYTFRTAGGSADIGDREYDKIVGGSIVWNQLVPEHEDVVLGDSKRTFTMQLNTGARISKGHKYLFAATIKNIALDVTSSINLYGKVNGSNVLIRTSGSSAVNFKDSNGYVATILESAYDLVATTSNTDGSAWIYGGVASVASEGSTVTISGIQLFDLTQMFGSKIADYIYNLEMATAGAGVAWFRKYFPKDYYECNAGELMHVSDLQSHDMVGFNAFDASTAEDGYMFSKAGIKAASVNPPRSCELVPVLPNTTYYLKSPHYENVWNAIFFDIDKNGLNDARQVASGNSGVLFTTPANCYYVGITMLTADKGEINLNLSWDGERDGEYEPYVKHSYPLDSSLTLRGIPKLSTDGKLYYDGDHYKPDGTVERRYGIVDLGTLEWGYASTTATPRFLRTLQNCKALVGGLAWSNINAIISTSKYKKGSNVGQTADSYGKWGIYNGVIYITDSDYTDAASFKAAMSGVYLVYELEEPITETANAYQSPQIVDDFGTEEYVTSSIVPVGHITQYDSNLRAKLEMAPNSPDGDGDYLVRQTSGQNEYVPYTDSGRITALEGKIPTPPSTDGAYVLKCTVTDGTPTYSWVSA